MKILHLSDLHFGKRVNEFSMIEEQERAVARILEITDAERPDAVIIAGDVYDKTQPSAEAVRLFDALLTGLAERGAAVFVISGNHDSAERIAFGGSIMSGSRVYLAPVYDGNVRPVTLSDDHGEVDVFMLPFIKPSHVRRVFEDAEINSYTDAVRTAVEHMKIDPGRRNILVTHQFVTGAETCESEELSVGGSDNVDAAVFEPFDYVALGHLHGPQSVTRETVRYCGTPIKYSFSELRHKKSATIVELFEKGRVEIRTAPFLPVHDMREIRGEYNEIMKKSFYEGTDTDDYLRIILTDEEEVPDAIGKLRSVYLNIMRLEYDNSRTRAGGAAIASEAAESKTPLELFGELFEIQNNKKLSPEQEEFLEAVVESIWEGSE